MARFRLTEKHYLNVPETEWEQVEINQQTGKQGRHRYKVHAFLDPEDASMHTPPNSGEIIVTMKHDPAHPHDILFVGHPTASMEPLDEEAAALIRAIPVGVGPMSETAFPTAAPTGPAPAPSTELEEMRKMMAELRGQMTLLVGQNEALSQRLAQQEQPDEEPAAPPPVAPLAGIRLGA